MPGFFQDIVGLGVLFQTVSGASSLVAAGIQLGRHEVSVVNRNMALVPWIPQDLFDIYFPGVSSFSYVVNIVADWGESLFHSLARNIWDALMRESRAQITHATRELTLRGVQTFQDTMARVIERARWVVTNGPVHAYSAIEEYYRALPPINPAQARQLARRLEIKTPERLTIESPEESGEVVQRYEPPGGAFQRATPDWMLPLILGLYGDITPTWSSYLEHIEAEEDGPKKKRRKQ
ncbi:VP3 [Giant panda polyomavirus]|nr:VP3 [Giant panda polyomavirus]ASH97636.1 VP3 [Giant panda polyomavirus]